MPSHFKLKEHHIMHLTWDTRPSMLCPLPLSLPFYVPNTNKLLLYSWKHKLTSSMLGLLYLLVPASREFFSRPPRFIIGSPKSPAQWILLRPATQPVPAHSALLSNPSLVSIQHTFLIETLFTYLGTILGWVNELPVWNIQITLKRQWSLGEKIVRWPLQPRAAHLFQQFGSCYLAENQAGPKASLKAWLQPRAPTWPDSQNPKTMRWAQHHYTM